VTQISKYNFILELALSSVTKKDLEQARLYVRKALDNFLFTWSTLHPLAIGTRLGKLSSLQQVNFAIICMII
jgi:hypothetical protein